MKSSNLSIQKKNLHLLFIKNYIFRYQNRLSIFMFFVFMQRKMRVSTYNEIHFTKVKKLTACFIVRGKPSRINPKSSLPSSAPSLFDNKLIIISSDTN